MTPDDARPTGAITVEERPDRTVVHLRGEIDGSLRGQASAAMAQSLGRGLPVTADVGAVTFIDSTGLAFLLQLHKAAGEGGVGVTLLDPPALLLDLLGMIGMGDAIPLSWTPARPATTPVDTLGGTGELATV